MSQHHSTSLQLQYIISAVILGVIVLITTTTAYTHLQSKSRALNQQTAELEALFDDTSSAKYQISQIMKSITIFILEPNRENQRQLVTSEIQAARNTISKMKTNKMIGVLSLESEIPYLLSKINAIEELAKNLFLVRVNANKQYPALAVSSGTLQPIRDTIHSIFSNSINELFEMNDKKNYTVLDLLTSTRYTWLRVVSEYRLYITNRIGSFSETELLKQEKQIEYIFQTVHSKIAILLSEKNYNRLGFEGQHSLPKIPGLLQQWMEGYQVVKKIHHSGKWRRDTEIMRDNIIPVSETTINILNNIEKQIKSQNRTTTKNISLNNKNKTMVLIGVVFLFLTYIFLSMILLRQFLIKPMSLIAKALKSAATNPNSLSSLNLKKTKETSDLLDAFAIMSEQITKRQSELEHRTLHDNLTGLPNRNLLQQRLDYQSLIALREKQNFSLLMLDLNRFKEINDTLGHHIGDELLMQVSTRLSNLIRKVDTIARLGGDEFAILLPNTSRNTAAVVAEKITSALKNEFHVNNYALQISSSIGIAEHPTDGDDVNILMQHADIAMYISKKNKSIYEFYDPKEDTHSLAQLSLGRDLETAIKSDFLEMYFQPKINILNGEIDGAEALLRWNHPEFGFINPEKIIEIAEHVGLINQLTYWIIHQSIISCTCADVPKDFDLSINLAVQSLRDTNLITETMNALENNPGFNHRLTFEITESAMMNNPEQSINILNALKKLGILISIDDFGTGFSSLAYLKQLPVNQLKIDKSFVMDMHDDESDRAIVFSTINLSHSLGLTVVAEGVETQQVLALLKEMKCDITQGYLISKPVPGSQFISFLKDYNASDYDLAM